jgi:hypothetical protein
MGEIQSFDSALSGLVCAHIAIPQFCDPILGGIYHGAKIGHGTSLYPSLIKFSKVNERIQNAGEANTNYNAC